MRGNDEGGKGKGRERDTASVVSNSWVKTSMSKREMTNLKWKIN